MISGTNWKFMEIVIKRIKLLINLNSNVLSLRAFIVLPFLQPNAFRFSLFNFFFFFFLYI